MNALKALASSINRAINWFGRVFYDPDHPDPIQQYHPERGSPSVVPPATITAFSRKLVLMDKLKTVAGAIGHLWSWIGHTMFDTSYDRVDQAQAEAGKNSRHGGDGGGAGPGAAF